MQLTQIKWFVLFLARASVPTSKWLHPEFQFTATNYMSMAAKSTDLVDETSGANLQMEGYVDVPPQSAKDLWELEALDSSPSHLPSWSLGQRLLSSHPNTKYCLEICVTLTEELEAVLPSSHSWTAPLIENMLHDARTGLTEAVVTGPGRAVLFYRRCSMGDCLTTDKARDATFPLTEAGTWVGKLATSPQIPWQSKKVEGPLLKLYQIIKLRQGDQDVPVWICRPNNPSSLIPRGVPLLKDAFGDGGSDHQPSPHWPLKRLRT